MASVEFKVNLDVENAFKLVKKNFYEDDLVESDFKSLGDNKFIGILVFEQYYFRVSNRVSLVVIIDNFDGITNVKAIGSGGGTGLIFKFDWGASDSFAHKVKGALKDYIIE